MRIPLDNRAVHQAHLLLGTGKMRLPSVSARFFVVFGICLICGEAGPGNFGPSDLKSFLPRKILQEEQTPVWTENKDDKAAETVQQVEEKHWEQNADEKKSEDWNQESKAEGEHTQVVETNTDQSQNLQTEEKKEWQEEKKEESWKQEAVVEEKKEEQPKWEEKKEEEQPKWEEKEEPKWEEKKEEPKWEEKKEEPKWEEKKEEPKWEEKKEEKKEEPKWEEKKEEAKVDEKEESKWEAKEQPKWDEKKEESKEEEKVEPKVEVTKEDSKLKEKLVEPKVEEKEEALKLPDPTDKLREAMPAEDKKKEQPKENKKGEDTQKLQGIEKSAVSQEAEKAGKPVEVQTRTEASSVTALESMDPEEDYPDFLDELRNFPERFQKTAESVKDHIKLSGLEKYSAHSKELFNQANQQIQESFTPLIGKEYAPFIAYLVSYGLLLLPLGLVMYFFEKVRAIFSLQKILLFINMYLAAYFAALLAACFILDTEPMDFFRRYHASSYIFLQLLQAFGYMVYLLLNTVDLISTCSDGRIAAKLSAVLQWVVVVAVGFHYYVTVFHRAMARKAPITSWKVYGLYSISFVFLCLSARIERGKKQYPPQEEDDPTDKKN